MSLFPNPPIEVIPPAPLAFLKTITVSLSDATFKNATIATRMLQLLAGKANTMYVPLHVSLDVDVAVAGTNNPTNIELSVMADPSTGSEGDMTTGSNLGFRGDGALATIGRSVHYQAVMAPLNVSSLQVGINQVGEPLWFVPRSQWTGGGSLNRATLTVLYYEVIDLQ